MYLQGCDYSGTCREARRARDRVQSTKNGPITSEMGPNGVAHGPWHSSPRLSSEVSTHINITNIMSAHKEIVCSGSSGFISVGNLLTVMIIRKKANCSLKEDLILRSLLR